MNSKWIWANIVIPLLIALVTGIAVEWLKSNTEIFD